jgi:polysaccharide export outer membrane protein
VVSNLVDQTGSAGPERREVISSLLELFLIEQLDNSQTSIDALNRDQIRTFSKSGPSGNTRGLQSFAVWNQAFGNVRGASRVWRKDSEILVRSGRRQETQILLGSILFQRFGPSLSSFKTEGDKLKMHRRDHLLLAVFLLFALGFAKVSFAQSSDKPAQQTPPSSSAPVPSPATQSAVGVDYRIGPQDVLQIDVWKEQEITRTIPVRPDGKISLPLLNDVQAAGLTAMQLAASIREGLSKFINNPQVTVTVGQINSRRVFITGEVARSGALPLLPDMTVLQALSSAGGFTQFAREKNIYVLRVVDGKQTKLPFNYHDVVRGKHQEQNILMQPGDVIVVP